MARESTQHDWDRVLPPGINITFAVETGGAIRIKEVPFVATGPPIEPLPKFKDRKFLEVTSYHFDRVNQVGAEPPLYARSRRRRGIPAMIHET